MSTFIVFCLLLCLVVFLAFVTGPVFGDVRLNFPRPTGTRSSFKLLQRVANRFHGELVTGSENKRFASIRIEGNPYRIECCKAKFEHSREIVTLTTTWPARPIRSGTESDEFADPKVVSTRFRMSITPARAWEGRMGVQDVEIGDPFFDSRFVLQTNDKGILLETLTKQCQILINKIYVQFYEKQFELRIVGDELQLDSHFQLSRPGKLFLIIRTFAELHRVLMLANEVAYSVDVGAIDFSGSTTCLICGDAVVGNSVKCRSCLTEYHHDCWQYIGRCGRYACGEKGFLKTEDERCSETYRFE